MSEYQYYEFAAIDRPLTRTEMAKLRAVSTRAVITPSGFVNHYEWGDLKADPADWMRRYFDAFVYTANWCCCRFALRVPLATFDKAELKLFATRHALTIEASNDHWIIDWSLDESENYDRFGMDDGSGWMRRLVRLRDELLRGDLRPLYLGWLAGAATGEVRDAALEPEVPLDLSRLSPPQRSLVEFLEIDPDLLSAAAAGSPSAAQPEAGADDAGDSDAWLDGLSRDDMGAVLRLIVQGQGNDAERQVKSRHAAWQKQHLQAAASAPKRRSLGELRCQAQAASRVRLEREAKVRRKQETERGRQREAHLRKLMSAVDKHWDAIDAQAQRGSASGHEQAVRAIGDLAEGYALTSSREEFDRALRRFLMRHNKCGALMRRLADAGLWQE